MANPTFLLTSLGASVTTLGGWGAIIVWLISVGVGGLHNNLYAELAAMFPKLAGGVAIFAHEAWKRYTAFVGPDRRRSATGSAGRSCSRSAA